MKVTWYAAHIIMQVEFKSGDKTAIPVWENVHLIEASSSEDLLRKCYGIGRASEGDSEGTFHWDNKPARWVFKGVRKTITISNLDSPEDIPGSGCEITYSTLIFSNVENLEKYLREEETTATLID